VDKIKRFTGDISQINWSLDKYEFDEMLGIKHHLPRNSINRLSIGNKLSSSSGSPDHHHRRKEDIHTIGKYKDGKKTTGLA